MPKPRQSNQGRVSPSNELTSAKQDVELGQSHMDVTLSVWRDSELASSAQGVFRCVAGRWGFGKGASRYSPFPRVWGGECRVATGYEREPGMANWPLCMDALAPRL